jgi:hypothetical protein
VRATQQQPREQNPGFNLDRFKDLKEIDGRQRFEDIQSTQQQSTFIKYENVLEELNETTASVYKQTSRDKASAVAIKLTGF